MRIESPLHLNQVHVHQAAQSAKQGTRQVRTHSTPSPPTPMAIYSYGNIPEELDLVALDH